MGASPDREQDREDVPVGDLTFETAVEELEAIIDRIESGEIGLEASLAARRRGEQLIKRCRSILETAEQELEQLTPEPDDDAEAAS